jgi:hypothetical protein
MVRYIRQNGFVAVEDLDDLSDQSVVALNYNMNYVLQYLNSYYNYYLYIRLIVE